MCVKILKMSYFHQDSVFWVEVDKIYPNPYQPRKEFNEEELQSLANSIRQYGVLQALVVTRKEVPKEDGGLSVEYELISGERRLRASKLAGVKEVPVLIREGEENDLMKLELAIIENLQREDLNVVERALAFEKLAKEFSFSKTQIAKKVGKSREYVSNTMRVLMLSEEILDALSAGKISEGHARPLMMLVDYPDEQQTLFKEVMYKKISVREAERIAKKIAKERVRKPGRSNPEIEALEKEFTDSLGTRVNIEAGEIGGKISIAYFSQDDLVALLEVLRMYKKQGNAPMLENFLAEAEMKEKNGAPQEPSGMSESVDAEPVLSNDTEDRQETEQSGDSGDIHNKPEPQKELQEREVASSITPPTPRVVDETEVATNEPILAGEGAEQEEKEPFEQEVSRSESGESKGGEHDITEDVSDDLAPVSPEEPPKTTTETPFRSSEEIGKDELAKDVSGEEKEDDEDDLYSVRNFTL